MRRIRLLAIFGIVATGIAAAASWNAFSQLHQQNSSHILDENLTFVETALHHELVRFATLPTVLTQDPRVISMLSEPDRADRAELQTYLDQVRERTEVTSLTVTDAEGVVLVASAADSGMSVVGRNLALCAYFVEAITEGEGCAHSLDTHSGVQGYNITSRVDIGGAVVGTVTVGVSLTAIEASWTQSSVDFALVDENDIIFLSSNADWKNRSLTAMPLDVLAAHSGSSQFSGIALTGRPPLFRSASLYADEPATVIESGLMFRLRPLGEDGWRLMAARPFSEWSFAAAAGALIVVLLGVVISGGVHIYMQRGRSIRIKTEQSAELQQRVDWRTRELQAETAYRLRIEQSLRVAEDELVQATKLAALGQLSAALAHEVSQPLMALAATLTAADRRLAQDETDAAQQLVRQSQNLVSRLQHIVKHLRSFARKEPGDSQCMDISTSIVAAMELAETRAREIGVDIATDGLDRPVEIIGSPVRLEQVLVNLLLNALDAVAACSIREVGITLGTTAAQARITVWDTGPGVPEQLSGQIAEPFFTTKSAEDGLGLGLTISQSILKDFGGTMRFLPRAEGGTLCEVLLPLAKRRRSSGKRAEPPVTVD